MATVGPVIVGMGGLRPIDSATVELKRMRGTAVVARLRSLLFTREIPVTD